MIYYVRMSGNDSWNGQSPSTAFKTVQKAVDTMFSVTGNHTCYIGPGNYPNSALYSVSDNHAGKYLVFIGDPSGKITGDIPAMVQIPAIYFSYRFTSGGGGIICISDYITCEVRNIFSNIAMYGDTYYSVSVLLVGNPADPPPVTKDTLALRLYCYNCVGRFAHVYSEVSSSRTLCYNCVGTHNMTFAYYSLDLATECYSCIGIFNGKASDKRIGVYHCCIQDGNPSYMLTDEGTITANPQFVDDINFYLKEGSPCIDTGMLAGDRPTDMMGIKAPQNLPDMGVHEYVSDLFNRSLVITKPRYIGYDMLDYVEGVIPTLVAVEGEYPLIHIYIQIANSISFNIGDLLCSYNSKDDTTRFEYYDGFGWLPYPASGAGQDLYGKPFRCLVNLSSPRGWLLFLKAYARWD